MEIKAVAPQEIESKLQQLWDSTESSGRVRATLFNLIIYTKKDSRGDYVLQLAKKIIQKFPSRIILVTLDPEKSPDYIKTAVSLISSTEAGKDFACDFIDITLGEKALKILPFLILPQLICDLPVYLLWTYDICQESALSAELEKFTNRLILDSESTENLICFAKSALYHKERSQCDIADLNWARLESWRDLLSSTFYEKEHLEHLKEAREIVLYYNAFSTDYFCHTKIQAIYLQAYLACQLGWIFVSLTKTGESLIFAYTYDNCPITISLHPENHPHLSPGNIIHMDLKTKKRVHYEFQRDLQFPHQITLQITTPEQCFLPAQFIFAKGEAGLSLIKEVSHKGTSEHYLKVLKLIAKIEDLDTC